MSYGCHTLDYMIVFDASTLILLSKAELLEVFVSDFKGKVLIPGKVKEEILSGSKEGVALIIKLINERKIHVLKVNHSKAVKKLMEDFNIDEGEAEVLILAVQEKATMVATDDGNAMKACKLLKMDFTTAITFLIRAFEKDLINQGEALSKLQRLAMMGRYSRKIIEDGTKRIKEGEGDDKKNIKHTNG